MVDIDEGEADPIRTKGTAVFAGGGAWLPDDGDAARQPGLVLTQPHRLLVATSSSDVHEVLKGIEEEQQRGNYVAGYLAYEAGAAFGLAAKPTGPPDDVSSQARLSDGRLSGELRPDSVPLAWMAVYRPEHVRRIPPFGEFVGRRCSHERAPSSGAPPQMSGASLDVTYEEYAEAIGRVREYIAAGDTYQVNYTVRARFDLGMDPLEYFEERAGAHPVPYGAYLDTGAAQVISLSPELFLQRRGPILESRPMKGTRPRGGTSDEDTALAYELIGSEKDRAENLMIVDMVRNDIGRVSVPGTVAVPALYTVEPYGTVWQMSSAVIGRLVHDIGAAGILAATFPGASITGAPKHHTMEIIREVEKEPRGVYTGFVGLFLPGGDFTCNLCIRTLVHRRGRCLLGVGSGVVWDSRADEEYEETLTKATFAFPGRTAAGATVSVGTSEVRLFETILLEAGDPREPMPGGGASHPPRGKPQGCELASPLDRYASLTEHLSRLASSSHSLGLPFNREAAVSRLLALASDSFEAQVVRLEIDAAGEPLVQTRARPEAATSPVCVALSPFRTDPGDGLLRHKTTRRSLYDREYQRARENGFFDVLFLNRLDRVTEGAITNICVRMGTTWVSPPTSDGLLPGIWRARFLAEHGGFEKSLRLDDLLDADEIVLGNSVRGSVRVGTLVLDCLEGLLGSTAR